MAKAVLCPVCDGKGTVSGKTCHGCGGKGWVEVQEDKTDFVPWCPVSSDRSWLYDIGSAGTIQR